MERAQAVQRSVRVVKQQCPEVMVQLLGSCFSPQDSVDTIRQLCIGEGNTPQDDVLALTLKANARYLLISLKSCSPL